MMERMNAMNKLFFILILFFLSCEEDPPVAPAPSDCLGVVGGSAVEDECGVCNGDNSTCTDCAGVINGDAVEDACGVCDGDGDSTLIVSCPDGTVVCHAMDCSIVGDDDGTLATDGCDLSSNSLYLTSDGAVLYNSSEAIAGFQFYVNGQNASNASGGDAEAAGFDVSIGPAGIVVLGFSLSGSTIAAGCGTLTNLELEGAGLGLYDITISDSNGNNLGFTYYQGDN